MHTFDLNIKWIPLLLTLLLINCKDNPTENKARLIPSFFLLESNEVEGWTRSLELGNFIEAENAEGLAEIFRNEPNQKQLTETFMAFHFVRGVKQIYDGRIGGATETLALRIFDMKMINHAQALFYDKVIKPPSFDFLDTIGDEGRISVSSSDNNISIDFYYDKWYVWIFIRGRWGAMEAKIIALKFAEKVSQKLRQYYPVNPI